ncbi:LysE family transporter [Phormidium tenue FACHB-886]|nr:LysE family transporter [Phormidium tenue FACHB-886]
MQFLADWITIALIGFFVIISPGANFAMTLRNSLLHSRRAGIYTAMGLAAGDLVHVAYCLVGIGVVISRSILLFNALKWLGALYLIYIGIRSLQAKQKTVLTVEMQRANLLSSRAAFRMGFLTSLLNPKVTLFVLALFTQIIRPDTPIALRTVYGLTIAAIEFGWFSLVAIATNQPFIKTRFLAVSHWVDRAMGVILVGLGLRLAVSQSE